MFPIDEKALQEITALAAIALGVVKPVVDVIKLGFPKLPDWAIPLISVAVSVMLLVLLGVSAGVDLTLPVMARVILASLLVATGNAGINRLHDKATEARLKAQPELRVNRAPGSDTTLSASL